MEPLHPLLADAIKRARWCSHVQSRSLAPPPPPSSPDPLLANLVMNELPRLSFEWQAPGPIYEIYHRATLIDILKRIAIRYEITIADMKGSSRSHKFVRARAEYFYVAMLTTSMSMDRIGRMVCKDHTCVIHGVARHCREHRLPLPRPVKWSMRKLRLGCVGPYMAEGFDHWRSLQT